MHRLFVALRPPAPVRAVLMAAQEGVPGARWQDDDQLHLTLRFIGTVERRQAEDVAAALGVIAAPVPMLRIAGIGRFDGRGRHGGDALWAAVTPREPLAALHRKVDRACVVAGCVPERRAYLPHVTLARLSHAAAATAEVHAWLGRHAGMASEPFRPSHLVLYESRLGREGASYEPVARWPLGSAAEESAR